MKNCLQKICWQIFIVSVLLTLFFPIQTRALEVKTHRAINEKISDKSSVFGDFSLHQYLIKQLGMEGGVETVINKKLIIKLLGDGGETEDDGLRPRSHFLNPLTNQGLVGICYSALEWATLPVGVQGSEHYSWNDVRVGIRGTVYLIKKNNTGLPDQVRQ